MLFRSSSGVVLVSGPLHSIVCKRENLVKMKLAILSILSLSSLAAASWTKNLNYRSPSENHPGMGISLHKVNKRNTLGKRFTADKLNFTHSVASGDPVQPSNRLVVKTELMKSSTTTQ